MNSLHAKLKLLGVLSVIRRPCLQVSACLGWKIFEWKSKIPKGISSSRGLRACRRPLSIRPLLEPISSHSRGRIPLLCRLGFQNDSETHPRTSKPPKRLPRRLRNELPEPSYMLENLFQSHYVCNSCISSVFSWLLNYLVLFSTNTRPMKSIENPCILQPF